MVVEPLNRCQRRFGPRLRAGRGVGLLSGVAASTVVGPGQGLVSVPLADLGPVRRVAAYWSDILLATDLGRALHREVLAAPLPPGALALGPDAEPPLR